MLDFRKKIFGLAGATMVFAGMAYAQTATCTAPTSASTVTRAEDLTAQVADVTTVCTNTTAAATVAAADGSAGAPTVTLFLNAAVSSKLLQTAAASTQWTEALAIVTVAGVPVSYTQGVTSG